MIIFLLINIGIDNDDLLSRIAYQAYHTTLTDQVHNFTEQDDLSHHSRVTSNRFGLHGGTSNIASNTVQDPFAEGVNRSRIGLSREKPLQEPGLIRTSTSSNSRRSNRRGTSSPNMSGSAKASKLASDDSDLNDVIYIIFLL